MALPPPESLSPSSYATFRDCGMRFRFAVVERRPEPPSREALRGTLVHRALERLFERDPVDRTRAAAGVDLQRAAADLARSDELVMLEGGHDELDAMAAEAEGLLDNYFSLEDPTTVTAVGLELRLDAKLEDVVVRGVIDRLDLVDGQLVVVDYKTGRAPDERFEQGRLTSMHVYSLLCEANFGVRPASVRLLYLTDGVRLTAVPSDMSSAALERRIRAAWDAITLACERDDFRPRVARHCDWCAFRSDCPAFAADVG